MLESNLLVHGWCLSHDYEPVISDLLDSQECVQSLSPVLFRWLLHKHDDILIQLKASCMLTPSEVLLWPSCVLIRQAHLEVHDLSAIVIVDYSPQGALLLTRRSIPNHTSPLLSFLEMGLGYCRYRAQGIFYLVTLPYEVACLLLAFKDL
jgi:hypothetical protein